MRLLTLLLANGDDTFTLHAELNWRVLLVTLGLAVTCGVMFGLAPAIQSTRPAVVPALKGVSVNRPFRRRSWIPRLNLTDALVVTQISILLLLLTGAGAVSADALEPPAHSARLQSRERAAVRAECPASRLPDRSRRHVLLGLADPTGWDSRSARRDAFQLFAHPGRLGHADHDRRRAATARHPPPADRARLLHDDADSDAARPRD